MRSQMLSEMMAHIMENRLNIDSVLIVRNGYLVLDAYFFPYAKGHKHDIYSCTKSFISALIGIAIDKGFIQHVDQPIKDFFPDRTFANMNKWKKSITLEHLLMMTTGLKCRDSWQYRWAGLFEMRASNDWAQHVLDRPMAEAPGVNFDYCNGASHLLSVIIQNTTKMKTSDFARKHLFEPLGIDDFAWAASPQNVDIGYCCMWLTPHDMAKLGWLYINSGRWENKQVLPSGWVEDSTRGHVEALWPGLYYGYQWWLVSNGHYMAIGKGGQCIIVAPEKKLVAVFTADIRGTAAKRLKGVFDSYIMPAAILPYSLPSNTKDQMRLEVLVKNVGAKRAFIWASENKGVAQNGVFERSEPPAFTLTYPEGAKKTALRWEGQVMRMKTPDDILFGVSVIDIPGGLKLEDFAPKFFARELEKVATDVKIISNKEITLACGTKAYRTDFTYLWEDYFPVTTYLVSAYKDGKCIYVGAHPYKYHYKAEPIVQSLTFK